MVQVEFEVPVDYLVSYKNLKLESKNVEVILVDDQITRVWMSSPSERMSRRHFKKQVKRNPVKETVKGWSQRWEEDHGCEVSQKRREQRISRRE